MGCVSSKLFRKELENETKALNNGARDNNNNNNHPNHIVSLTSSTYGLLNLEKRQQSVKASSSENDENKPQQQETKPEVINAWELMEGLEEAEQTKPTKKSPKSRAILLKGFGDIDPRSPLKFLNQIGSPRKSKTLGGKENRSNHRASSSPAANTYYTPRPVLRARKSVREDPTKNDNLNRRKAVVSLSFGENNKNKDKNENNINSGKNIPLFEPELVASYEKEMTGLPSPEKCPPGGENAVVVYTTTLRGIRKTFEDCNRVRTVIWSHPVRAVERDVSMDSGFREELRRLRGTGEVRVPAVFVKGRFVGGAEEVIKLEEEGRLVNLFEGVPRGIGGARCGGCAGFRFVMCCRCSGSCKVLDEKEKKILRCGFCNENGLVKCLICC